MKQLLILIIFICSLFKAYSQQQNCGWFGTMKPAERMKQFPFNKAKRIVLISFPASIELNVMKVDSTKKQKYIRTEKVVLGEYPHEYNIIKENELTDAADIDKLSNIMINYKIRRGYPRNVVQVTGCYEPRNGILFYDEKNVLICFYEICFECKGAYISPENEDMNFMNFMGGDCYERINLLHEIFVDNGMN